jgi:hypothetical protein
MTTELALTNLTPLLPLGAAYATIAFVMIFCLTFKDTCERMK